MIKKILPIVLCVCLISGISAMASNSVGNSDAQSSAVSEGMPMQGGGGGMRGGRGGMGTPPGGEMPAMPDGEMPSDGMMPPQNNGDGGTDNVQQTPPANNDDAMNENSNSVQRGGMQEPIKNTKITETASQRGIFYLIKTYSTPIISVILLALAFVFVVFYKRKSY